MYRLSNFEYRPFAIATSFSVTFLPTSQLPKLTFT